MAERRSSMMYPPVETLLKQVDSRFTLVTLAAKRGRQINSYFKGLGEGIGAVVPPQVASTSRKPLSIALEEVAAEKLEYRRIDRSVEEAAAGDEAEEGGAESGTEGDADAGEPEKQA